MLLTFLFVSLFWWNTRFIYPTEYIDFKLLENVKEFI